MQTITFKGNSDVIETNGKYTYIEIIGYTDKIVTPLINFVYLDGENDAEPLEANFKYEILYTVSVFFETSLNHECTISYKLH